MIKGLFPSLSRFQQEKLPRDKSRDPRHTNTPVCLLSIIFEVASSRDQLWKTENPNFNPFPSFKVLSGYFYVSLNLTGIL